MGQHPLRYIALTFAAGFLSLSVVVATTLGAVKSGNSLLLSFDIEAVSEWTSHKKSLYPDLFERPECLNMESITAGEDEECLISQSVFFLEEVNQRRQIERKAMRQILKITDDKRRVEQFRAELAAKNLKIAHEKIQSLIAVDEPSGEKNMGEKKKEEDNSSLLSAAQLDRKKEKIRSLEQALEQMEGAYERSKNEKEQLEKKLNISLEANKDLRQMNGKVLFAYRNLATRLSRGLTTTLSASNKEQGSGLLE